MKREGILGRVMTMMNEKLNEEKEDREMTEEEDKKTGIEE